MKRPRPLCWEECWWTLSRGLLRHFSKYDPAEITIGQVLSTAMGLLGMREVQNRPCHGHTLAFYCELAGCLEVPVETMKGLVEDKISITPELAITLHERTGVPVSYWHLLRKP